MLRRFEAASNIVFIVGAREPRSQRVAHVPHQRQAIKPKLIGHRTGGTHRLTGTLDGFGQANHGLPFFVLDQGRQGVRCQVNGVDFPLTAHFTVDDLSGQGVGVLLGFGLRHQPQIKLFIKRFSTGFAFFPILRIAG